MFQVSAGCPEPSELPRNDRSWILEYLDDLFLQSEHRRPEASAFGHIRLEVWFTVRIRIHRNVLAVGPAIGAGVALSITNYQRSNRRSGVSGVPSGCDPTRRLSEIASGAGDRRQMSLGRPTAEEKRAFC